MYDNTFFDNLKKRYNYDDKTIKALSLIVPKLITYYGKEFEEMIINAILNCEIIPCDSSDTINVVLNRLERKGPSFINDLDLKKGESIYTPSVLLKYNEIKNIYEIDEIDRVIITSHTYNFDSLKGLEVLTHALCHLIKSYNKEFTIEENNLIVRNGLSYDREKIIYDNGNIYLEPIDDYGKAFEEGLTIYDTEKIVGSIYNNEYKCYDYDSIYQIAVVLKDRYKLKNEINSYELFGDYDHFIKKYSDNILNIGRICDEVVELENNMLLSVERSDKDILKETIDKILMDDAYNYLMNIYSNKQVKRTS